MKSPAYDLVQSDEFRSLVFRRWRVAFLLTTVMVTAYFGFLLCLAMRKESMAWELFESTPVGIPAGIGLILLAWVLTGVYIFWANRYYDKEVSRLRKSAEAFLGKR